MQGRTTNDMAALVDAMEFDVGGQYLELAYKHADKAVAYEKANCPLLAAREWLLANKLANQAMNPPGRS